MATQLCNHCKSNVPRQWVKDFHMVRLAAAFLRRAGVMGNSTKVL